MPTSQERMLKQFLNQQVSHNQTNPIIKAYQTVQLINLLKSYLTSNKSFDPIHKNKANSRQIYIILEIFPQGVT